MMASSAAVPLTPHNQKGGTKSGPVPDLITTLRNDNRDQLLSLLALDPLCNDMNMNMGMSNDNHTNASISGTSVAAATAASAATMNISHRQKLIFATDSLRTLLLYHTLLHPDRLDSTNNNNSKKKKKGSSTSSAGAARNASHFVTSSLSHDEQAMGLSPYNSYGIVNTKIIFPSNHTCTSLFGHDDGGGSGSGNGGGGMEGASHGRFNANAASTETMSTSTPGASGGGIETIYNPSPTAGSGIGTGSGSTSSSALFNIHHDIMADPNEIPSNVIVYFVLPIPDHVRAVCKIINAFLRSQHMNANANANINANNKMGGSNKSSNNPFDMHDMSTAINNNNNTVMNTKLKHRIVFLQRCTKLCTQILYNENILPPPNASIDHNGHGGNSSNNSYKNTSSSSNSGSSNNNHNNNNTSALLMNTQKNIVVHTLDINVVPVEDDILTLLETSSTVADMCPIRGVPSLHVNCIADSIMKIQTISCGGGGGGIVGTDKDGGGNGDAGTDADVGGGYIPRIQSFGKMSESVLKRCYELRREEYYDTCIMSNNSDFHVNASANINTMNDTDQKNGTVPPSGDIQAMMILDRRIDLVTPMITPLTYEGLLDDVLSIQSGILHVKTDIIDPPEEDDDDNNNNTDADSKSHSSKSSSLNKKKKQMDKKTKKKDRPLYTLLPLNDQDTLYVEVRDQHVEKFGSFLQEQAKALKESHANFSNKDKDLTEIHMFVKQIPIFTQNLKSLTHHIHLAELIKHTTIQSEFRQRWQIERSIVESESCFDVIEDLIASQYNVWRVLRLLCLHSLTNGGIKTNKLDALKREVVQTYGYEFVFLLQNLESIGLLRKKDTLWDTASSSSFVTMRKHLQLIQADVDPLDPDDVSYVSSGFAPISARIIQTAMKGWSGKEEALKEIPGRGIDVVQKYPPEEYSTALKRNIGAPLGIWAKQFKMNENRATDVGGGTNGKKKKPVLLVYFIGGITYAEIATLRFMSKRNSFPFSIICCTTKIINGTSFLQSLA